MTLPLQGIRVLDFTAIESGPSCTQMLAWFGADVIKIEQPGVGDVTRHKLRDIADVDALYFTMLNSNKRSFVLDTQMAEGKAVLEKLIQGADILVENFHYGVLEHNGFTWQYLQQLNPRLIFGSIKGVNHNSPYKNLKTNENIAQAVGGVLSTTGFWDGPPTVSSAALGGSNTGMHLLIGLLAALLQRSKTGTGQKVLMSMQDAVLNLCRVKLRDQQRVESIGHLAEYPQACVANTVPRAGNASGGGQPGWLLKCKDWQTDPNAYLYFTLQDHNWSQVCQAIHKPQWIDDPKFNTVEARQPHIFDIFAEIEKFTVTQNKYAAMKYFDQFDIPCGPVLSMKEIAHDPSLRQSGSIVEVSQKDRGTYLTVGCPIKFSAFNPEIKGAPLLGEHSEQILQELGYSASEIVEMRSKGAI